MSAGDGLVELRQCLPGGLSFAFCVSRGDYEGRLACVASLDNCFRGSVTVFQSQVNVKPHLADFAGAFASSW
jgi:hypothetical protein